MIADGYTEDFVEIYREFEQDLPSILDRLQAAVAANDASGTAKLAHQAKGSAANFGLVAFSAQMAEIEQTAKLGAGVGVDGAVVRAREIFANSLAAIKAERGM